VVRRNRTREIRNDSSVDTGFEPCEKGLARITNASFVILDNGFGTVFLGSDGRNPRTYKLNFWNAYKTKTLGEGHWGTLEKGGWGDSPPGGIR